ncbi:S41 family peptidase [Ekhidna sp.]|uniref:S41 family peptidase n=1 Tax=Ekhidna sp. TaxID=2608089 RepID=UPI003BA868F5
MKFLKNKIVLLIACVAIAFACSKDDGISVDLQNEVNEFVWFGMRDFYYWVDEVDDLSNERYPTYNALYTFLNGYSDPKTLFDDLLVDQDRFSWIVDDYEELEASFQGISKSFGYEVGLLRISADSDDLLAYVKYVVPDGPAENGGLVRGDVFTEVNGTQLTVDNFVSLLFENESYTITLSQIQDNVISSTGERIALTAIQLTENPILKAEVLEVEGQKIAYLMYNQFVNNNDYHEELNNAFGEFKSAGATELVLDLRYNGGGSLTTSRILSSMIYGAASANDILGSIVYNQNLANAGLNADLTFLEEVPVLNDDGNQISSLPMNRMNINRVFVLVSGSSASASEFVIAGLLPYMNVTLIGTTTVGKNVGSATLYDSDNYLKSSTLNPNHKYAIQPIISQLANSEGFTDYIDGLDPNIVVDERNYLGDLKPLGDTAEPLLAEALAIITGVARTERLPDNGMESIPYEIPGEEYLNTILLEGELVPDVLRTLLDIE